mgnify:CR=1 FL=1
MENDRTIARTQYSIVLAWALTPWKAQGMSLDKVVVKLGAAASKPGVAFVALTRARHPDGLALDEFPAMSVFQRQKKHHTFQTRQKYERQARATFSKTIRKYMRDADIYTNDLIWTEAEAAAADDILHFIEKHPAATSTDYLATLTFSSDQVKELDTLHADTWRRLHDQYPHMFAVAAVRQTLDTLNLDGTPKTSLAAEDDTEDPSPDLIYKGWSVSQTDLEQFTTRGILPLHVFQLLFKLLTDMLPTGSTRSDCRARSAFILNDLEKHVHTLNKDLRKKHQHSRPLFRTRRRMLVPRSYRRHASFHCNYHNCSSLVQA